MSLVQEKPLVSIIMTCFNMESHIEQAVFSVLNQDYPNIELIVVDDNSQDDSLLVLKEISDSRLKVYSLKRNKGTYYCRNVGILKSTGDFFACHDADDIADPHWIFRAIEELEMSPDAKCVMAHYLRFYENKKLWLRHYTKGLITSVYRREILSQIGFFDCVRASADDEYHERIKKVFGEKSVKEINEFLYFALQSKKGLTSQIPIKGPDRKLYYEDYRKWHATGKSLFIPFPMDKRVFPVRSKSIELEDTTLPDHSFQQIHNPPVSMSENLKKRQKQWRIENRNLINSFRTQLIRHYKSSIRLQTEFEQLQEVKNKKNGYSAFWKSLIEKIKNR